MDTEFDRRWKVTEPPFDGMTVVLTDFVPLTDLRPVLAAVVDRLQAHSPEAHLYRQVDWHEHDGYIKEAEPSSWAELQAAVISDATLQQLSQGDTYVRTDFFPAERDFLLRVYIPDVYDNPLYDHDDPLLIPVGVFDVTCAEALAHELEAIAKETGADVRSELATAFFDRDYGG